MSIRRRPASAWLRARVPRQGPRPADLNGRSASRLYDETEGGAKKSCTSFDALGSSALTLRINLGLTTRLCPSIFLPLPCRYHQGRSTQRVVAPTSPSRYWARVLQIWSLSMDGYPISSSSGSSPRLPDPSAGSPPSARLILFDKRGTGLSDPVPVDQLPTLEQRMDDVRAVMDAAGSEQAALMRDLRGWPDESPLRRYVPQANSGAHPRRQLMLRLSAASDYPWEHADRGKRQAARSGSTKSGERA